jgi:hypothetical protein
MIIETRTPVRGEPTPEQRAIGPGDYVISEPGPQWPRIYGYVWTRQAFIADLRADGVLEEYPDPVAALEHRLAVHEFRYQKGYVYGMFYSEAEIDGEQGESHVSTCRKISESEFNAARERGWA